MAYGFASIFPFTVSQPNDGTMFHGVSFISISPLA
nr:MAG TPA: hypothetical protein [Caudoviricetes sp.]DAT79214.1 MAG TPA: hypothetical protein [Caudoviricetes sp.]DAY34218.1 MAG TPA: hypothetical protein [Caudoviricetes sp.]